MRIIDTPEQMRAWAIEQRCAGKTIGLVPTMGALHEGHASLMREAVRHDDVSVLSIFVNPTQFAPHEDFDQYPRTFGADADMAEGIGMDLIYAPKPATMYPQGYATYVNVERITEGLCGAARPTFFRGVATVVTKLFTATLPHRAYFGQKDAQQCAVIKRMARDLDLGVEIVEMPIIREPDGIAMSSRNVYLDPEERKRALCLSRSLEGAKQMLESGERDAQVLIETVKNGMADVEIDYVALVDADEMTPLEKVSENILLAVAAFLGKTRLIDNLKYNAEN